jgi:predicted DCC family thiol-disulfide oxidoreductase YuxK
MSEARKEPRSGWIFFDGECEFCRRSAESWRGAFERRGFDFVALQMPWVRERLALDKDELLREMRVMLPDGRVWGGADAVVELARHAWWGWPLIALAWVPGMKRLLRAGYRAVAARRSCAGKACAIRTAASRKTAFRETA